MVKKVVWTKRSIRKFNAIIDYLEKEWGAKVAENFVKRTYEIIELISDYPEIGTLENAERAIRGFSISKHNRLFYRINESGLILLNFFDNRSNRIKDKH